MARIASALASIAIGASACVATEPPPPARGVLVNGPPPAPIAEARPAPPGPTATWVAGYWHWTGVQYTWVPGHWESPPPGAQWQAPQYSSANGAYTYEPGVWKGVAPVGNRAPATTPPPSSNAFR